MPLLIVSELHDEIARIDEKIHTAYEQSELKYVSWQGCLLANTLDLGFSKFLLEGADGTQLYLKGPDGTPNLKRPE